MARSFVLGYRGVDPVDPMDTWGSLWHAPPPTLPPLAGSRQSTLIKRGSAMPCVISPLLPFLLLHGLDALCLALLVLLLYLLSGFRKGDPLRVPFSCIFGGVSTPPAQQGRWGRTHATPEGRIAEKRRVGCQLALYVRIHWGWPSP